MDIHNSFIFLDVSQLDEELIEMLDGQFPCLHDYKNMVVCRDVFDELTKELRDHLTLFIK